MPNAALKLAADHLSPVHMALSGVRRLFDAEPINLIMNHPAVRPHLGGDGKSLLDLTNVMSNPANIVLSVGGFAAIYLCVHPGLYEIHTQALPESRGHHTALASQAVLHWIFANTNCVEVLTKVPGPNDPARRLVQLNNFDLDCTMHAGDAVMELWSITMQRWMARAAGLVERGAWFHRELEAACQRAGVTREAHADDPVHDRYVGAAVEMWLGGQTDKAIIMYNRWASQAGYKPCAPIQRDMIHIGDMAVQLVREDDVPYLKIVRAM